MTEDNLLRSSRGQGTTRSRFRYLLICSWRQLEWPKCIWTFKLRVRYDDFKFRAKFFPKMHFTLWRTFDEWRS